MNEALLEFDISKTYPGFSLNCQATFGEGVTAIFGTSGSGKSTLLNCIAGLIDPSRGNIRLGERTIFDSESGHRTPPEKRRFGYLFQDSALFPHLSVLDNICYGYKLTPDHLRRTEPDRLIDLLRIRHLTYRKPDNLSGGEKQRVALARALATSPELLLLDEPLSSLDVGFKGVIMEYLKQVRRDLGTSMIYVSHSISEVIALADDVVVLASGKKIAQGNPTSILAHPEVTNVSDFATLENYVEAEVIEAADNDTLSHLKIGDAMFVAPRISRDQGDLLIVSIGAGDIIIALEPPPMLSARNVIKARIEDIHQIDGTVLIYADIGERLIVEITPGALNDLDLSVGCEIYLIIKTNSIIALDVPD